MNQPQKYKDPLMEFLERVSYKFPKGYPDINNPQDNELLFSLLKEVLESEESQ